MQSVKDGKIKVSVLYRSKAPTPLAYHILAKYANISELMAPHVLLSNIKKMKRTAEAKTATLMCINCGEWGCRKEN